MKHSVVTRVGLSPAEMAKLRKLSTSTGVPLSRLIADAVRATHLKAAA